MESRLAHDLALSDEELVRRCSVRDELALKELLGRHQRPVFGVLYRMLGSREDAEEALADVFVKVWRGATGFRSDARFTTWLYRIATNTARDVLRARRARPEVQMEDVGLIDSLVDTSPGVDPEQVVVSGDRLAGIDAGIQRLSEEDRLVVTLYHINDYSLEEIARIVGQSRATLKVRLFRARQRLRTHLADLDRENGNELQSGTTEPLGLQPEAP